MKFSLLKSLLADGAIANAGAAYVFDCHAQTCAADVTGDGTIAVADLVAVIADWGACRGCAADVDDNGVVDVSDLVLVLTNWGPCP